MVIKDTIVSFLSDNRLIGYHHILLVQSDSCIHHLPGHLNGLISSLDLMVLSSPTCLV